LAAAGYDFVVVPADVDERLIDGETPTTLVRRLAGKKAARIAHDHPGAVVLGADTVVVCDGVVLGKPADDREAAVMIRLLSGRWHDVLTGVALWHAERRCDDVASTRVAFRPLSDSDVTWYVASGEPSGKAGAYAIQGRASRFVTRIEGSYSNVVGLPMEVVDRLLRSIGILTGAGAEV